MISAIHIMSLLKVYNIDVKIINITIYKNY